MKKSKIKNDIYSELFELAPSTEQIRKVQIIESAIINFSTIGVDKTSYEKIAENCKISRQLIKHYYKDKQEIFKFSVEYIRINFQKMVVERVKDKVLARDQLEAYIDATFEWPLKFPNHARTWQLFFYYCGIDKSLKKWHTEMVAIGHQRIMHIINSGIEKNELKCKKPSQSAKNIQIIITGGLVAMGTENITTENNSFKLQMKTLCLKEIEI